LWIAAILTLWSAYEYLRDTWGELMGRTQQKNKEPATDEKQQ